LKNEESLSKLKPLFIGRVTRLLFGLGTLAFVVVTGTSTLTIWGAIALIALGLSFLVGGIVGNPGCELTAIPNLFLSENKKAHCL